MNLLEVNNLKKVFTLKGINKNLIAVNNVSLEVSAGETLALVGESGSGKTTIGRCVLRTLTLSDGKIVFNGYDITKMSQRDLRPIRKNIQAVFQDPLDSLNPTMSSKSIIEEPLIEHFRISKNERYNLIISTLDRVGLSHNILGVLPNDLTPSQLQRLAIARAIITNPKLIILDEPTSTLDPIIRVEILRLLLDLQKKSKISYLLISHDLVSVAQIAHKIAIMYLGEIVEQGLVNNVYNDPLHPYTRVLLASAPNIERKLSKNKSNTNLQFSFSLSCCFR